MNQSEIWETYLVDITNRTETLVPNKSPNSSQEIRACNTLNCYWKEYGCFYYVKLISRS